MNAISRLTAHHIKPSVQRIAIMDYLLNHCNHPTVEEIYADLSMQMPTLSRTTVYNTLRLFSDQGAAKMLNIDERRTCYDACTEPHGHFLCKRCGHIYDLAPLTPLKEVESMNIQGHEIQEIHYYYKGICKHCQS